MQSSAPDPYGSQPPIIIYNTANAAAATGDYRLAPRRRRQSGWAHFWLFLFTAGIGNIIYAVHISNWNRARGL